MQFKTIEFNKNQLAKKFKYEHFEDNDTLIIESGTGTGKSYTFTKYLKWYLEENPNIRLISIFGKKNLGLQQKKYFNEAKIETYYYKESDFKNNINKNLLICINSIWKYEVEFTKEAANTILFLDEISIFTTEISHNTTITELRRVYSLIKYLIARCHKLYVCQNEITEATLQFIERRIKGNPDVLYVKNTFKQNTDKPAIRYMNVNALIKRMKDDIKDNKYFLFASDSKEKVDRYYKIFTQDVTDETEKNKYVKFTSNINEKFHEDFDFSEKYVFYSPSITTGVDCSLPESQNQYIYITGKSVDSVTLYQMSQRTRNIKKLYYYCEEIKKKNPEYTDLDDCINKISERMTQLISSNQFMKMCFCLDENDEIKFTPNSFVKLYCINELLADKYSANLIEEFEKILKTNGFKIRYNNTKHEDFSNEIKIAVKENKIHTEKEFMKFCDDEEENDDLKNTCDILQLNEKEDRIKYKDILIDSYKLKGHFNFIKLFQKNEYLEQKIDNTIKKIEEVKLLTNIHVKIRHIKLYMTNYNITYYNIMNEFQESLTIKSEDLATLKSIFNYRGKIKIKYDLIKFITIRINDMCNFELFKISKRLEYNEKKYNIYYLDNNIMEQHFELYKKRGNFHNIEQALLDHLNIEIEDEPILGWEDIIDYEEGVDRNNYAI